MKRIHSIRPSFGMVIATYTDEEMAHTETTIEQAKADFIGRADRTIADLRQRLDEWEKMRAAATALTEADFLPPMAENMRRR